MAYTTYSFTDVDLTINHPSLGQFVMTGQGVGTVSVSHANDVTKHELSADGTVMISKIRAKNGTLTLTVQQNSSIHQWLTRWFNYLSNAITSEWASGSMTIRSKSTTETITLTGVSPQKQADRSYQAEGQNINWALMVANVQIDLV